MPLHNVSYMTPFGTSDIFKVVDTMADLQANIPAVANEWTKYNNVYLGGVGLDTYGILTNFPVKTVDDIDGHKIAAPGPSANWIKGTGAVAVAANLNTYYNGIKTGVFEGTLTFMTAGAAIKVYEVAPHICMVNFGAQFAGGLSVNKDVFESFPPYMQKIFKDVGAEYATRLAQAQTDKADGAMKAMEKAGAKVIYLSDAERKRWANKLPNVSMNWAEAMEKKVCKVRRYCKVTSTACASVALCWSGTGKNNPCPLITTGAGKRHINPGVAGSDIVTLLQ